MAAFTYKCPHCGGAMTFDPEGQTYRCPYCLSALSLEELEGAASGSVSPSPGGAASGDPVPPMGGAEMGSLVPSMGSAEMGSAVPPGSTEMEGAVPSADSAEEQGLLAYTCPSCGAEIIADETTAATFCYYCHNPVLLQGRLEGSDRPDYVIPFQIGREKAEEIFSQWIGRKRYAPSGFYARQQIDHMAGVYFPYWLYCCQVDGELEAEGTKLRVWDAGDRRYTEKKVYQVRREGQMQVDHLAQNALKKANGQLAQGVLPVRPEGLLPFHMSYLSGFMAEKRDIEKQELAAQTEDQVRELAATALRDSAGEYSSLTMHRQRTDIRDAKWEQGLLPVWTLTYRSPADGQLYYFALNGQTGKACGKVPVDRRKLLLLFLTVFFPLLAAVLLLITGGAILSIQWYQILLALGAGAGIAGSVCWGVIRQYDMEEPVGIRAGSMFQSDCSFTFREQSDQLIHTAVTHTAIPQQQSLRQQGQRQGSGRYR